MLLLALAHFLFILPSLLEHNKLSDSHSVSTSAVLFLWGDKLAQQRTTPPQPSSKQQAGLSGKMRGWEL